MRRALERKLFEEMPFERGVGSGPWLTVEVVEFGEVRRPGGRRGRVELTFELHDDRAALNEGSIIAERNASDASIEATVVAIGNAMGDAVAGLSTRVEARLGTPGRSPTAPAGAAAYGRRPGE